MGKKKKFQITRLLAFLRDPKHVPERIMKECNIKYSDGCFKLPDMSVLKQSTVVVSTCSSTSYLVSLNCEKGFFSHIFIDEAGEAILSESLIPISLKGKNSTVILAGDPKQLGPVIRSSVAIEYGLDVSLLERTVYCRLHPESFVDHSPLSMIPLGIFHLVDNYRAHPAIMDLYNNLFYDGNLLAKADRNITDIFLGWDSLVNRSLPIIFKHVDGDEERDVDSPSWYNKKEIQEVFSYVNQILSSKRVKESDIGILTPYRKQSEKLRQLFYGKGNHLDLYKELKIGTTENFQGIEKKVIIITCVRSQAKYLEIDHKFSIGFASSPKRINVAISRPQCLLIILGNVETLSRNENFKKIITTIDQKGGYIGPSLARINSNAIEERYSIPDEEEADETIWKEDDNA
jgi:helicase MOV-10